MATDPLLLSCVGLSHDLPLLPHFVAHYRRLGVRPERFRLLLNTTDPEDPRLEETRIWLAGQGIEGVEAWIAPYTSETMWAARRDLQQRHADPGEWVLSADVDEFHEYPLPLGEMLDACGARGVDCVQGVFIDRIAEDGVLAPVAAAPGILDQFPISADVGWSLAGGRGLYDRWGTVKLMAMRGRILPERGGHHPQPGSEASYLYGLPLGRFSGLETPGWRFRVPTRVHHVHWTEALPARLRQRLDTPGVSAHGRFYGQIQLDHFAAHGGVALDEVHRETGRTRRPWQSEVARLRRRARVLRTVDTMKRLAGRS